MDPYYSDSHVTLYHGDALDVLRTLPDQSVDCCVTSPPYFGLRDYGVEGQYGLEASPAEYVEQLRAVFAEVRRVLAADGTLWVNIGDSFAGSWGAQGKKPDNAGAHRALLDAGAYHRSASRTGAIRPGSPPAKNLLGIPWRLAFALQDDGWVLRNDVIWAKPNGMPESVTDRLATKHEHLFLLTKSRRYHFDLDAIREPLAYPAERPQNSWARDTKEADVPGQSMRQHRAGRQGATPPASTPQTNFGPTGKRNGRSCPDGRNPGDVWVIPTVPFPGAHYAVMAPELARRAVLAGCKPGGVVLDPFSGSGTTGMVAIESLRRYVGIELSRESLDLSLSTRLRQGALPLEAGAS